MKQLIMDVLEDMSGGQINLASEAARKMVATTITAALKTKGSYKEYTDYELDEQEARKTWVCSICGKNTFEVDYDYLGSGTNHLGCELEIEMGEEERREKNWSQKKHEEKVFGGDTGIDADFGYDDIPEGLKRAKELSQEAIKEGMESSYKK
jgi:ribosomal protein L37E